HAGTTPMDGRLDAGLGASAFRLAARDSVLRKFPGSVVNVGNMAFEPGAFNIVPELVTVALEFRAETLAELDELERRLLESASHEAERFGLNVDMQLVGKVAPAPMAENIQQACIEVSQGLGLGHKTLASGAGHDAQSLAAVCPTGMIFVPSVEGISHSPKEFTAWDDCMNGADVLLQTVLQLAR
ncbi:MAG: M20/M25/M40 family metallo-hydrolase, partial [bacterium]|nr:M20/M25/M40 family metallo-hydrolase [bacterium]